MLSLLVALSSAALAGPAAPPASIAAIPAGTLVDLSHDYGADTVFWPTADRFSLKVVAGGVNEKGFYYAANDFCTAEHGGTHLDAPIHFAEGRNTVDRVPLTQLIGPAVVVDVRAASAADADLLVGRAELAAWEKAHGRIPDGAIVLIATGFSERWPDPSRYLGTAKRGPEAVPELHFPGLAPDAARWLVAERKVSAVGIDTASIDYGQSTMFETHRILSAADVPAMENLAGLERLPATGAHVIALPMKIRDGSGGPLRAVAVVP